jgi:DNA mismatch repair protein MutS2
VKGGPGGACLTVSSTHHGALTSLKYEDDRFENSSVEFDEVKLAPTYR